jgi:hypothetical protein
MTIPRIRSAAVAVACAVTLAGALLAGCGSGAGTSCSLSECTITFDRGDRGDADVLGVSVELVSATDSSATVSVAGQEATVPLDGSREVSGFTVRVRDITADEVVVLVSR